LVPFFFLIGGLIGCLASFVMLVYVLLGLYVGYKKGKTWNERLQIFQTFPILHFSYGLGYLTGILSFLILRKKPSDKQKRLSR
jgi:hypothetical protein